MSYPLETLRHSASHLLAAAVKQLFPEAKFDIGPATEQGFYYDFDLEHRFTAEDLKALEKAMKKLIGRKIPFVFRAPAHSQLAHLCRFIVRSLDDIT